MDYQQFNNILRKYNIKEISEDTYLQFRHFYHYLIEENNKYNLTTITDEKDVYLKHFIDSLLSIKYLNNNSKILDIGCGAGFPSVPLAIYNENFKITDIDSVNKKVNFVNNACNRLKINNLSAIHTRIEDLAHKSEYRECFDIVVSRAVAPLNTLLEYAIPFLKVNGLFIAYKSLNTDEEINQAKNALKQLNCSIFEKITLNFEEIESNRTFLIIKKEKTTNKIYPRIQNKPRKQPL